MIIQSVRLRRLSSSAFHVSQQSVAVSVCLFFGLRVCECNYNGWWFDGFVVVADFSGLKCFLKCWRGGRESVLISVGIESSLVKIMKIGFYVFFRIFEEFLSKLTAFSLQFIARHRNYRKIFTSIYNCLQQKSIKIWQACKVEGSEGGKLWQEL